MLVLITKESCPICIATKKFLSDKKIIYKEKRIGVEVSNDDINTTYKKHKFPIILLNDHVIHFEELIQNEVRKKDN